VSSFSPKILPETFLILRRFYRHIVKNVETSSCKVPVIFVGFEYNFNFLDRFTEKFQISSVIEIPLVGAELFHADRRTDEPDEANSRFSQF
jgi:hypothetical protein